MSRPLAAALAATLLATGPAAAAEADKPATKDPAASQAPAQPGATPPAAPSPTLPGAAPELDARTRAIIQAEVEKAKQDIRNEVRAEIQGAQSATEFLGAVSEGPKLEFLEWSGYFRVRGDLFDNFSLGLHGDPIFPSPLQNPTGRGTLATANMRFRLEPTFNISEQVRIRTQIDILDNYVLGSNKGPQFDQVGSPYPIPYSSANTVYTNSDPTADRPLIQPKRVWGEVQTPVGLLSFGRMPSQWGLGVLANAGAGVDADYGDTVDRIQFALPPVPTPIGNLAFVPMLDFDAEGVLYANPQTGPGLGQPFDAEQNDDARTYAIKIARLDTDEEIRRKLDRNESSVNYGVYYAYRTQQWYYPTWYTQGYSGGPYQDTVDSSGNVSRPAIHRGAYAHFVDLWGRYRKGRLRIEGEAAYIYGSIGDPASSLPSTTTPSPLPVEQILLRQWGGAVQSDYEVLPSKLSLGFDFGAASDDPAPGFGNNPSHFYTNAAGNPVLPEYGAFEGPQWGRPGDRTISNFRFNPAYRVDLIFYRQILGQVTSSWYLRPHLKWDILPGLSFESAIIYSQAFYRGSTPSASQNQPDQPSATPPVYGTEVGGHKPLGVELDGGLKYWSGDGFGAWFDAGVFQPLSGFGTGASRAWALRSGVAIKF